MPNPNPNPSPSPNPNPGARATLARVAPRRGRLLVMPHACPHAAAPTEGSDPKVVLRGELLFV